MEEIANAYTRKRMDFGRPPNFTLREAALLEDLATRTPIDIKPDHGEMDKNYVQRNPVDKEVECRKVMSAQKVNTETYKVTSQGVLHIEGGWPNDVNFQEHVALDRYRRKIMKNDDFTNGVKKLSDVVEQAIMENNAVDIYEEYWAGRESEDMSGESPSARTLTLFRDPNGIKRSATCISWYSDSTSKLAVSYAILQFQGMREGVSMNSYIWDVENPNYPEMDIIPTSPLWSLEYNPKDPPILVGGSYNGLVAFWDTRKGSRAYQTSAIEKSHRDPVYSVKWIASKSASELLSASTDGHVNWWDIRKMSEPVESIMLKPKPTAQVPNPMTYGGVVMDYEWSMPTKFMVGTEQGEILSCNKKTKNPLERIGKTYVGHFGPVRALQRNPFFPKYFLTVGDWTARLWFEDIKSSIITTKYQPSYMTHATWSPTRPGVFYTSKRDGTLDVWDFFHKQNDPTLTIKVAEAPIHYLAMHGQGRYMAVGDMDGTTTLMEVSPGLYNQQLNEKKNIQEMFERETKREKMLETRARELAVKSRKTKAEEGGDAFQLADVPDSAMEDAEHMFYESIKATEEEQRARLGDAAAAY